MSLIPESPEEIMMLQKTFLNISECFEWFFRVIYNGICPVCPSCRARTIMIKRSGNIPFFRCTRCRKEVSIFYNTLFYRSKLTLSKILLLLLYIWLHLTQSQIFLLTGVGKHTIGFYQSCSRVIMINKLEMNRIKLGGPGKRIQIDEAIVRKRKYHRGRPKQQIWIFGMVEEDSPGFKHLLLTVVPNRSMWVLIPIIAHHVLPGSTIISDEWRGYSCLDYFADYQHETVNHSEEFKNHETGANTNKIEGVWSHLRRFFPVTGVREAAIEDYLASFIVRHQGIMTYETFVRELSKYKPTENHVEHAETIIKEEDEMNLLETGDIYAELHDVGSSSSSSCSLSRSQTDDHASPASLTAPSDELISVPVVSEIYSESDASDDPYGAGTGESASEYSED